MIRPRVRGTRIRSLTFILLTAVTCVAQAGDESAGAAFSAGPRAEETLGQESAARSIEAGNPFDAAILNNEAVEKFEKGDHEGALALMERAARLAPQHAGIQRNHWRLRHWLQARGGRPPAPSSWSFPRHPVRSIEPPPPPLLDEPPAPWQ